MLNNKVKIREYQTEIIKTILRKIKEDKREIFIEMATGTGKYTVIEELISHLETSDHILMLTKTRRLENEIREIFKDNRNIEISNYYNMEKNKNFSYLILNEVESMTEEEYKVISKTFGNSVLIFFGNSIQRLKKHDNWLTKKTIDYSLSVEQVMKEGYINPNQLETGFVDFVQLLLKKLKLTNIEREVSLNSHKRAVRIDYMATNHSKRIIVEVKSYGSKFARNNINQAVEQVEYYKKTWEREKKEQVDAVLIVSSKVSDEIKETYYKERKILIIDISNLLYLTQEDDKLMRILLENVRYNIYDILPKPPLNSRVFQKPIKKEVNNTIEIVDKATNLIKRLEKMRYGKEQQSDKRYEKLCVDMIKFLFETEFTKMREQNRTEDGMFKMDLVCGLKGNSEFWKILIQHYNTRIVVFEFKNYEYEIQQNLIYTTEKYLYNAVLRNVAIIISRNGFSNNARKATTGILTESGKLIIELKDEDLITMLRMKADGEEASDYMLNKLEEYLMSISK